METFWLFTAHIHCKQAITKLHTENYIFSVCKIYFKLSCLLPLEEARWEGDDALVELHWHACVSCTSYISADTQGVSMNNSWERKGCSLCLAAHLCAGHQSASCIKSDVEQSFTGVELSRRSSGSGCGEDGPIPKHLEWKLGTAASIYRESVLP